MGIEIDVAGKLFPNITTIVVQLLATGFMLFMFKKFLWVPVQDYFKKRADYIDSTVQDAKQMQQEAKILVEASDTQAKQGALEYRDLLEQAKLDATKVKETIVEEAKEEAQRKLEQAKQQIEQEQQLAKQQMKEEIVDVAIEITGKVLSEEIDVKSNQQLVDKFIKEVEAS